MNEKVPDPSAPGAAAWSSRRSLVATGAVAALAGLGSAWWRSHTPSHEVTEPVPGFWGLQWDSPQGSAVRLSEFRGRPLLINFWATWCPPCIEELPLIDAFFLKNKANGWQVLGLAVDKPMAVQAFLQRAPLHFPVGIAGMSGAELGRSLGNLVGGLPFSIMFGADGSVLQRKMGKLTTADLDALTGLK